MKLANIWKKTDNGIKKCNMVSLKIGDRFVYQLPDRKIELIAVSLPYKNEENIWTILAETVN